MLFESHSTHTHESLLHFRGSEGSSSVVNKCPPIARRAWLCPPSGPRTAPRKLSRFGDVCRNQPIHHQLQNVLLDLLLLGTSKHPFLSKPLFLCPAPQRSFSPWSPATPFIASSVQQGLAKCPLDARLFSELGVSRRKTWDHRSTFQVNLRSEG